MDLNKRRQELEQQLRQARTQYWQVYNSIENIKGAIAIVDEQLTEQQKQEDNDGDESEEK